MTSTNASPGDGPQAKTPSATRATGVLPSQAVRELMRTGEITATGGVCFSRGRVGVSVQVRSQMPTITLNYRHLRLNRQRGTGFVGATHCLLLGQLGDN